MLLSINNLPLYTTYKDVEELLIDKCGDSEFILDGLVQYNGLKKVTVGVAEEDDAALIVWKLNGLDYRGLQLYVYDLRHKKASEQQKAKPFKENCNASSQCPESGLYQSTPCSFEADNNTAMPCGLRCQSRPSSTVSSLYEQRSPSPDYNEQYNNQLHHVNEPRGNKRKSQYSSNSRDRSSSSKKFSSQDDTRTMTNRVEKYERMSVEDIPTKRSKEVNRSKSPTEQLDDDEHAESRRRVKSFNGATRRRFKTLLHLGVDYSEASILATKKSAELNRMGFKMYSQTS